MDFSLGMQKKDGQWSQVATKEILIKYEEKSFNHEGS